MAMFEVHPEPVIKGLTHPSRSGNQPADQRPWLSLIKSRLQARAFRPAKDIAA